MATGLNVATGQMEPIPLTVRDDVTRTVTLPDGTTRPYTEVENRDADEQAKRDAERDARLDDLDARLERIEAHLWPPDPDPTPGTAAPTWADHGGIWPAGQLLADGGKVWRNVAGVPLTTPPSGFPGTPAQWNHPFVQVAAAEPEPEPPAAPAWSATATYKVGDVVERGGTLYRCLVAHGPEYQGTWGPPQASVWSVEG